MTRFFRAIAWRLRSKAGETGVAVATVLFAAVIFLPGNSLSESVDYILYYRPNFQFLVEEISRGRWPLWNPYVGLGRPFLGDIQNAFFYPPAWLAFLGGEIGLFLLVCGHCLLAVFGMRALARALGTGRWQANFAAFTFLASAEVTGRFLSGQILYCCALCYLPLLFRGALELQNPFQWRRVALHAGLMALQFLCGHPQAFWISVFGQGMFILGRAFPWGGSECWRTLGRGVVQFSAALLWSGALVGVALIPFLQLIAHGNRAEPSVAFVNYGQVQWLDFFSLFADPPYQHQVNWETNLYLGMAALIPGLLGLTMWRDRNLRALALVFLAAFFVAAGANTPLFNFFYEYLPGFTRFRLHGRTSILLVLALSLGAAAWLTKARPSRAAWLALALFGSVLLELIVVFYPFPRPPEGAWIAPGREAVLAAAVLLGCALFLAVKNLRQRILIAALFCAIHGFDVMNANFRLRVAYSFFAMMQTSPLYPYRTELVATLRSAGLLAPGREPPRVCVPRTLVPANYGMMGHYSNFDAYTSLFLRRPWEYLHGRIQVEEPEKKNTSVASEIFQHGPFPDYPELALSLGMDPKTRQLVTHPRPAPRAYLAYDAQKVDDETQALALLRAGHPGQERPLIEKVDFVPGTRGVASEPVAIQDFTPGGMRVDVAARQPALLVFAEAWYPGWIAELDGGRKVDAIPANGWMRAFDIPAGQHQVRVVFRQDYLFFGAVVSALAIAAWIFCWRHSRSRMRGRCPEGAAKGPDERGRAGGLNQP